MAAYFVIRNSTLWTAPIYREQLKLYSVKRLEQLNAVKLEAPTEPPPPTSLKSEYAVVIFDSEYGNTEKVAHALARGLHQKGLAVDCVNLKESLVDKLDQYGLFGIGGPTQAFSATQRMKNFLETLEDAGLQHKSGFAFDTKLKSRFAGSGGGYVEKKMRKLGFDIIEPHFSAIVKGKEGPLEEGSEQSFESIGAEIADRWRNQ